MFGKSRFLVWTVLCVVLCFFLFIGSTTLMACGDQFRYDSDEDQWYRDDCEGGWESITGSELGYELPEMVVTAQRPYDSDDSGVIYREVNDYDWLTALLSDWYHWNNTNEEWDAAGMPAINLTVLTPGQFISTDFKTAIAEPAYLDPVDIEWSVETLSQSGSGAATLTSDTGMSNLIGFNPDAAPDGRGYALSYRVTAFRLGVSASVDLTQDNISQLRQEYVDMGKNHVPLRSKFDNSTPAYQGPHPWGLLNANDNDSYHTYHILNFINQKAIATDNHYSGTLFVTAGYACPKENGHGSESQHIYGKAFDFDAGSNNATNSKKNYDMYKAGKKTPSPAATWGALYDSDDNY